MWLFVGSVLVILTLWEAWVVQARNASSTAGLPTTLTWMPIYLSIYGWMGWMDGWTSALCAVLCCESRRATRPSTRTTTLRAADGRPNQQVRRLLRRRMARSSRRRRLSLTRFGAAPRNKPSKRHDTTGLRAGQMAVAGVE